MYFFNGLIFKFLFLNLGCLSDHLEHKVSLEVFLTSGVLMCNVTFLSSLHSSFSFVILDSPFICGEMRDTYLNSLNY